MFLLRVLPLRCSSSLARSGSLLVDTHTAGTALHRLDALSLRGFLSLRRSTGEFVRGRTKKGSPLDADSLPSVPHPQSLAHRCPLLSHGHTFLLRRRRYPRRSSSLSQRPWTVGESRIFLRRVERTSSELPRFSSTTDLLKVPLLLLQKGTIN